MCAEGKGDEPDRGCGERASWSSAVRNRTTGTFRRSEGGGLPATESGFYWA